MGRVYDITSKLTNERPKIKIYDKEYEINDSKNTAIAIRQLALNTTLDDLSRMDKITELALGKEALEYVNSLDLSVTCYSNVINAISAGISDLDLEDVENTVKENRKKKFRKK